MPPLDRFEYDLKWNSVPVVYIFVQWCKGDSLILISMGWLLATNCDVVLKFQPAFGNRFVHKLVDCRVREGVGEVTYTINSPIPQSTYNVSVCVQREIYLNCHK